MGGEGKYAELSFIKSLNEIYRNHSTERKQKYSDFLTIQANYISSTAKQMSARSPHSSPASDLPQTKYLRQLVLPARGLEEAR